MSKVGLFYGSTTGNTKNVAEMVRNELGADNVDLHDVAGAGPADVGGYGILILGVSTWGLGDLQDDWEAFASSLKSLDGRKVALFGLGDQQAYPDTFVNAMGTLYEKATEAGADVVGAWPTDGYDFGDSTAVVNYEFVGLALDEDRQPDMTAGRVKAWVNQLKVELGLQTETEMSDETLQPPMGGRI